MERMVGFSTGCLFKTQNTIQALATISAAGCRGVELGFVRFNQWDWLNKVTADQLESFSYVSLHAPKHDYAKNKTTKEILDGLLRFHTKVRKLDLVVVHPDPIEDFSLLAESGLPIGIENMDNKKKSGQTVASLKPIFNDHAAWKMVLDVNHVFSNDKSMTLATDLKQVFRARIAQIHLSGYQGYHEPISHTHQNEIIAAARDPAVPIIVESVLSPTELDQEKNYILTHL